MLLPRSECAQTMTSLAYRYKFLQNHPQYCSQVSHISQQQLRHWKQARAVHSCVNIMVHRSFTCEQAWMKHLQQQRSTSLSWIFDATFISFDSCNFISSLPGGRLLYVAVKLPKPKPVVWRQITFLPFNPIICDRIFSATSNRQEKHDKQYL